MLDARCPQSGEKPENFVKICSFCGFSVDKAPLPSGKCKTFSVRGPNMGCTSILEMGFYVAERDTHNTKQKQQTRCMAVRHST